MQALYRRWRPQNFDDVIGQAHVTKTLRNAVESGRLVHAYLFSGPRGTGKTSVARILAKAVNCIGEDTKPCNQCRICRSITDGKCLDLIEIDAASNTGVDDVRDLREKIGFAPNETEFKVYVIDEVHMLSRAAFNALLKTLEEPPPHAIFILATTEPHRLPDTIVSRCQRHDFRRVPLDELIGKLERIAVAEGIGADREALELIARNATGSLRDAESLLDQLMAMGDEIHIAEVRDLLGTPAETAVSELIDAMVSGNAEEGLVALNAAVDQGVDARQLRDRLLQYLRGLLLIQTGADAELLRVADEDLRRMREQAAKLPTRELAAAIHRVNEARPSADLTQPTLGLELALVETVLSLHSPDAETATPGRRPSTGAAPDSAGAKGADDTSTAAGATADDASDDSTDDTSDAAAHGAPVAPPQAGVSRKPAGGDAAASSTPSTSVAGHGTAESAPTRTEALAAVEDCWHDILAAVARHDKNTAALLKDCRPVSADDASVGIGFFYEFHCQRVSDPERLAMVTAAFNEVLGGSRELRCKVVSPTVSDRASRPRSRSEQAEADPLVRHAIDNLGARVVGVKRPEEDPDK